MAERDYSHRDVVDKLAIKPGHAVAFSERGAEIPPELRERVLRRTGRPEAADSEPADAVLVAANHTTDAVAVLREWRGRIAPSGGIWLLSPKRGKPGYVDQNQLIAAGQAAGVVDNKVCAVSDDVSAMRFVIRRTDRQL